MKGVSVHEVRREMGRLLAAEHPVEADLVIAVPNTGHSAAQGYSEVSRDPLRRRAAQEPVRGPDVHPAVAVAARAGREAQAEPAPGHDPRASG